MRALDQWREIEAGLDPDWEDVRLAFAVEDAGAVGEAAAALAPIGPGRRGNELRFQVARRGAAPDRLANLLRRLDEKRIWGQLSLVDARVAAPAEEAAAAPGADRPRRSLAAAWDDVTARLPPGWRDLLVELELDSTDYVAQAALVGAPLNPTRPSAEVALRFRVAARGLGGYGAPPGLVRRCLERMDAAGITGELTVLHVLSETDNVSTQGPVFRIAGKAV